ncbi:hypothetical protein Catovirus_1_688 [Catovirus CTV1]|uniref:Transmembrane protein n=1 Tax=Catovirus CTV1 TaxID=1977631 RepID=A0A1V0SAF9_9VIRU|nr:hypothetical protein Catovirus_1_688 [Catovirus CTV1]
MNLQIIKKALLIVFGIIIGYIIISHLLVNTTYSVYHTTLYKNALLYIDCLNPEYYSKCINTYESLINDHYSNKLYYCIGDINVLPGFTITAIAAISLYFIIPITFLSAILKYIFVQLYTTQIGNFIFLGLLCLLLFAIIVIVIKRSLNRQSHAQLILDLESN